MSPHVDLQKTIWAHTAPSRSPNPALQGTAEADCVVIGAGFTGLSAARYLAKQGRSVIVLEAKEAGWGASGRNNGQVIPILTAAEPHMMIARHGAAGERFAKLVGNSASTLFDIVREDDIDAQAEQTGWFQPAHSPGRVKLSQRRVEAWQKLGFPAELLDKQAAADLLGSDFWYGGMFNPTGGHINPLAFARGLAKAAEEHGAIIHEGSPVRSYGRNGTEWVTKTDHGTVKSRALILATNAYTGQISPRLAPRLARSIVPVIGWQMATQPLGDNIRARLLPGRQAVSDTRGDLRFFRYDAGNRLITGGNVLGSHNVEARIRAKAASNLQEAFPDLGMQDMTHAWNGYIGMTWDRFPKVHRLGENGWAWIACNGRGVALGTALGVDLAKAVMGEDLETLGLPVTEPAPYPAHGIIRRVAPYYFAWMKRKDKQEINL